MRNSRDCRRVLLIQPPYGDFTYPYHSLAYVAAPMIAAGYEVDVVDLNALWFRSLFNISRVRLWRNELAREVDLIHQIPRLSIQDQQRLVSLLQCMSICDSLQPERAVEIFRSEEFYDFDAYLWARSQVRAFEKLLSELYSPYDFFTAFAVPPYEPNSHQLVRKALLNRRFVHDVISLLGDRLGPVEYLFCGVSFAFSANLSLGMSVFPALRQLYPGTVLVAGGTAIWDVYKNRDSADALLPFQTVCDFFYVGEAETGVTRFADWCRGKETRLPEQVIDLARPDSSGVGSLEYVALEASESRFVAYDWQASPPYYAWVDWSLYLAPEKQVNYSPARGCYWNKCTFCDYGLNGETPTAPSRTMEAGVVVRHLQAIAEQGIRRVYFAVDAISPKFLTALAEHLLASKLDLRWSSQFFLTRQFTPDLMRSLAASGLRVASFGLESGSNRILELMGKGKNRVQDVLRPTFESVRQSLVGLQPLFFYGFPGETDDERQQTVDLLLENLDIFVTVSKGGLFCLLPGSIVAKHPEQFGLINLSRRSDENIAGVLEYEVASGNVLPTTDSLAPFNSQVPHWRVFERPWAGGIDTLHTQLYIERYGRDILHELRRRYCDLPDPWSSLRVTASFDLDCALENVSIYNAVQCPTRARELRKYYPDNFDQVVETIFAPLERECASRDYEIRFRQYHEV